MGGMSNAVRTAWVLSRPAVFGPWHADSMPLESTAESRDAPRQDNFFDELRVRVRSFGRFGRRPS